MRKKVICLLCLLSLAYLLTPFQVFAQDRGKVILIIMDRISWHDIEKAETPAIDTLVEMGGIGLMTTNTGGSLSQINAYTTLGAGARAVGASGSQMAFPHGESFEGGSTEEIYKQRTGHTMEPGSIANLSIAQLHRNNAKHKYTVSIGALGTALKEAGLKVAVIGNCDTPKLGEPGYNIKRYLVSMMMDDRGIVPMGEIDEDILMHDSSSPLGVRTNYKRMEEVFDRLWQQADVIAVQLGDTSRVEDSKNYVMDYLLEDYRQRAIEDGDAMIGKILKYFRKDKDLIILLSPLGPARELSRNNRLAPIIIAGKGYERGYLSSGSTHRIGIVTNLDIGATILRFVGASNMPGQGGAPAFSTDQRGGVKELIDLNERLVEIFNQRGFLLRSYVYIFMAILILSLGQLILNRSYLYISRMLLIFAMLVPLAFLILPLFHQSSAYISGFIALIIALALTALVCWVFPNTKDRITVISCATAISLVLDQWSGTNLIQWSPLGYDVIAAARFYGIGNEYMGVLIGAACTGGAGIIEKVRSYRFIRPDFIVFAGWAIILYTLGAPYLGVNVGGTIAALFAFSFSVLLLRGYKVKLRHLAAITAALLILLVGIFVLDSFQALDSQTHMGQTVGLIKQNGVKELLNIFERKISMNIRLFRYTIWTRVFLISIVSMVILFYRPVGIFKDTFSQHPVLFKGFIGGTIGSIAALVANDSGIVAAATCMIFIAPPLILLIMEKVEQKLARGELSYGEIPKISNT